MVLGASEHWLLACPCAGILVCVCVCVCACAGESLLHSCSCMSALCSEHIHSMHPHTQSINQSINQLINVHLRINQSINVYSNQSVDQLISHLFVMTGVCVCVCVCVCVSLCYIVLLLHEMVSTVLRALHSTGIFCQTNLLSSSLVLAIRAIIR